MKRHTKKSWLCCGRDKSVGKLALSTVCCLIPTLRKPGQLARIWVKDLTVSERAFGPSHAWRQTSSHVECETMTGNSDVSRERECGREGQLGGTQTQTTRARVRQQSECASTDKLIKTIVTSRGGCSVLEFSAHLAQSRDSLTT